MDSWGKSLFQNDGIYNDISDSLQTQQQYLRLMFTGEIYLSEVEFIEVLGTGETGTAVLYRHKKTGDFVVGKIIREELWNETEAEVQFMTRLAKSKYFLSPVTFFESRVQHTNHIMMEYFDGQSLTDFLSGRILNFYDLQNVLRQLGEAFVYMHSKGVIHLDINPDNILINENMEIKVIDFGHSMSGPEADGRYGSEQFAAPEVIAHKYHADAPPFGYSCDYYSLGMTVLSVAANLCHPDLLTENFGPDGRQFLAAAVAVQKELNPDGPQDTFYDLVIQLIQEDPVDRLNDKTFLSQEFFKKKFKKHSGELRQEDVQGRVQSFNYVTYERNIRRGETAKQFQKRIAENSNAKALLVERFATVMDVIYSRYDIPQVTEAGKTKLSLFSKVRKAFISAKCAVKEQIEEREICAAGLGRDTSSQYSLVISMDDEIRASRTSLLCL